VALVILGERLSGVRMLEKGVRVAAQSRIVPGPFVPLA
jgi:hypothetical protein